jgi:hypothetical protein
MERFVTFRSTLKHNNLALRFLDSWLYNTFFVVSQYGIEVKHFNL